MRNLIGAVGATVGLMISAVPLSAPSAMAQDLTEAIADAAGIPQMDAFLPDKYSVEETEALPIDGVWMISANRKKIKIENGRAYALDPWLHLLTLKIQRDMVVMQNFQRVGPGRYQADDLPLLGPATMQLEGNGNLSVSVAGALGPARYRLIKRDVDNDSSFQSELDIMAGRVPQRVAPPPPADNGPGDAPGDPLADCVMLNVDPQTGEIVCDDS